MNQIQSQPMQSMLRKLFPSALLVGVAKDPGSSLQDGTEPIYVYGFDEIITAKATPADIQRLLSRYQQQQHALQLFNFVTPGIDQVFISPEPTSAGLEQLSFISQLQDFSTYQSEESE
jgi:transcriptional regulator of heat shock response